jgi:hypothetical protein
MRYEPTELSTRLPLIASRMANIPLAVLVRDAHHYSEVRASIPTMRKALVRYQKSWIAPMFVHDFSLDILAKRVSYKTQKAMNGETTWTPE